MSVLYIWCVMFVCVIYMWSVGSGGVYVVYVACVVCGVCCVWCVLLLVCEVYVV